MLLAALLLGGAPAAILSCQPGHSQNEAATPSVQLPAVPARELRAPDAFAVYSERAERSRALFGEAARVMLHPRCANCHPSGDTPLQREGGLHDPPVQRGGEDRGVVGMECTSCHQDQNLELARVPGAPNWHLAPRSMAWVGRDPGSICEQIKDPARHGGKSLAQIVDHSQHDALVAWGGPHWAFFTLVGVAMVTYGVCTAWAVRITKWGAAR